MIDKTDEEVHADADLPFQTLLPKMCMKPKSPVTVAHTDEEEENDVERPPPWCPKGTMASKGDPAPLKSGTETLLPSPKTPRVHVRCKAS